MRRWLVLAGVVGIAFLLRSPVGASEGPEVAPAAPDSSVAAAPAGKAAGFVAGEVLLKFKPTATAEQRAQVLASVSAMKSRALSPLASDALIVTLQQSRAVEAVVAALAKNVLVQWAEPNYLIQTAATPNDPAYLEGGVWDVRGPASGETFGANAEGAWAAGVTGSKAVYVAVIDQGVDYTHPDLAANVWTNAAEVPNNKVDDDRNGWIDDVHGYNFVGYSAGQDNGEVLPRIPGEAHGTHVAGTIGAVGNNGLGTMGVNWSTNIISARALDESGQGAISDAIVAIDYVTQLRTQLGLHIVATNNSWTGGGYSIGLRDAIRRGGDAGILFIAAAGNGATNNDISPWFPGNLDCETESRPWNCIVPVAASGRTGALSWFSNYGVTSTPLAAPGENIWSTVPGGYGGMSGTSMAAPHVTGAVALCAAAFRGVSAPEMVGLLRSTVTKSDALTGKVTSGGVLNVAAFVEACGQKSAALSGAPDRAAASAIYTNRIRFDWTDATIGEYDQEIQIARGPAGCSGTFTHFAYIGPGLNSYPVLGLAESEFYCLRVRAMRESARSAWASNMTITWSSNLPFVTGYVRLADGTPVARADVHWIADGAVRSAHGYSDSDGRYVLQVSDGVRGSVYINTPDYHISSPWGARLVYTTPLLPARLLVRGGGLIVNKDTELNLTLPTIRTIRLHVIDSSTGSPVPGARITAFPAVTRCNSGSATGWTLFSGASLTETVCQFGAAGWEGAPARADANGYIELPVPDVSYTGALNYSINATDPTDYAKTKVVTVPLTSTDQDVTIALPPLRKLTGRVLLSDGTPVVNAPVYWLAESQSWDSVLWLLKYSKSDGSYEISLPQGETGTIFIATPDRHQNYWEARKFIYPTPQLPAMLGAYGRGLVLNADKTMDLTLPPLRSIRVHVVDPISGLPVQGAAITVTPDTVDCMGTGTLRYELYPGSYRPTTWSWVSDCRFHPLGWKDYIPVTDANGDLMVVVADDSYTGISEYTFSASWTVNGTQRLATSKVTVGDTDQTLTLTATMRKLSGYVRLADGTPVSKADVHWLPDGLVAWSSIHVYSGADGSYELTVPEGLSGTVYIETPDYPSQSIYGQRYYTYPTPALPAQFRASGGGLVLTGDKVLDLTLPPFRTITLRVVDANTETPIAGATVTNWDGGLNCNSADGSMWSLFPGAKRTNTEFGTSNCTYHTLGWEGGNYPLSDAQGNLLVVVADPAYSGKTEYTFIATHPWDASRTGVLKVTVGASNQTVNLQIPGTPSVPKRPSGEASSAGTATLTWTEPWNGGAFIDYYQVWWATNIDGPYEPVSSGTCAGLIDPTWRSCVVEGLTPGVTYYFAVVAHNVVGFSGPSEALTLTVPLPPAVATTYVITGPATGVVNVASEVFSVTPDNKFNGSITITPSGGGLSTPVVLTWSDTAETKTFTLLPTVTGTITLTGTNGASLKNPNALTYLVTSPPVSLPEAPVSVSAVAGDASAAVSWQVPGNDGGSPVTGYTVTSSPGGKTCSWTSGPLSCTVSGLSNGTAYSFTVTATNAVGTGPASAASSTVTPVTTPGAPSGVSAAAGYLEATVSWIAPQDSGGSTIDSYRVTASPGGLTCTATAATSCTVTGLTGGTSYTFTVAAHTAQGYGVPSAASAAVTIMTPAVPGAPLKPSGLVGNTQVTLSWSAPAANGSAITGYVITRATAASGPYRSATCTFTSPTATTCVATGLTNGTTYFFKVAARNGIGTGATSPATDVLVPVSAPSAPTAVTWTPGNGQVTLSWTAPANGGSAITAYRVLAASTATGTFSLIPCEFSTPTSISCVAMGLNNGSTIYVQVQASNAIGWGPASSPALAVTPGLPGTVGTLGVAKGAKGSGKVTVSWSTAAANGSAVIRYEYRYKLAAATTWGNWVSNGSSLSVALTLTAKSSYNIEVRAVNALGVGAASSASFTTP